MGERAMTAAERKSKQRERERIRNAWFPAIRPWDGELSRDREETRVLDELETFIVHGVENEVTAWLGEMIAERFDNEGLRGAGLDDFMALIRNAAVASSETPPERTRSS